nr:hypothetical protein [Tanacetum cinerariifolium]
MIFTRHARIAQPALYDGHVLLYPNHPPTRVHDSEESLVYAEVCKIKMAERPGHALPINYAKLNALTPAKPVAPFVHNRPVKSDVHKKVWKIKECITAFEKIIKERTAPPPSILSSHRLWHHTKECFDEQITPFFNNIKQLFQTLNTNIFQKVKEFERIFDELYAEYEWILLEKKNMQIEKKNLLITNECLIANSIANDICSIALAYDLVVPPSSDSSHCMLEELRTTCDREHSKVLELEAEILKKQQVINDAEKRCAFIQNEHLKEQLQGRDNSIRNLQAQNDIMSLLNVGSTDDSCNKQALETELTQLKDIVTSLKIQNDGYKVTNANLNRCYEELSKANTHLRTTSLEKIAAQKAEIATLNAKTVGNKTSGTTKPVNPKVIALGMYVICSKYIAPQRRTNKETPIPLPKKKQVTFRKPPSLHLDSQSLFGFASQTMIRVIVCEGESVYAISLCRSQGHTIADSYAKTSKDPEYITMNLTASNCESITLELEEHVPRAGKPVKKVLRMNLSVHRCSIHTVIIDPNRIGATRLQKTYGMLLRGICLVLNMVNKTGKQQFCMSMKRLKLLNTYIRYLQVINDLKKYGYSKDNCELNFKFLNNLQPEWKQYATMMRLNKNLMDINIDALYNILKQNQRDVNDAIGSKKKTVVVTSDPLDLIAKKTNVSRSKEKVVVSSNSEGSEADDFSELKKITSLLAKDFNRRKFYSMPTNNNLRTSSTSQYANKKQEFVKTDETQVMKKANEKKRDVSRVKCYNCKKEGHFAKDCKKAKEINANMVFMDQIEKVLSDSEVSSSSADEKISEVIGLGYTPMFLTHFDEALEIEKFKRSRENKIKFAYDYGNLNASYVNEKINFEDDYFQEIINLDFEKTDSPFQQTSSLKPYVSNVILEKIIIDLEDEVVNLLEKEKVNLETIESLKSKSFESSEMVSSESENQSENGCLVVEKECYKEENPKKKKRSSNASNVGLSAVSVSNLNKNVKRYSRKDLLACNNSNLGETRSAFVCNNAMNVSCDSRMNNLLDDNNFFIFMMKARKKRRGPEETGT